MMKEQLKEKTKESLASVLPITVIVFLLSATVVPMETGTLLLFLIGAMLLIVGMGIFQLGAELAMTPLGQSIGSRMIKGNKLWATVLICFFMGAIITIAEPDLQVLANQVASIPNNVLIYTVAGGVGIFLVIAFLRILYRISLSQTLTVLYILLFLLSFFAPDEFTAVAFDSGGVTTGPMTVPFIMVLLLGIFYNPTDAVYNAAELTHIQYTRDAMQQFIIVLPQYTEEVLISILPVMAVFILFQLFTRAYRRHQLLRMSMGFVYTIIGLILFLTGVNVGFAPVGNLLGSSLGTGELKWTLIPIGILVGYFIVKAEPAVQVLNNQVEDITGGTISHGMMNSALSIGVAAAVALAMVRVLTGLNIYWILIPGYAAALILSRFVPQIFVGIAYDSGGVASGPMTSTFLLPLAMGACTGVGGNVVTDAFGVVALVALSPLITIQIMGLIYVHKSAKAPQNKQVLPDDIIEFEEDE